MRYTKWRSLGRRALFTGTLLTALLACSTPVDAIRMTGTASELLLVECHESEGGITCGICTGRSEFRAPRVDGGIIVFVPTDADLEGAQRAGYHPACKGED